MSGSQPNPDEIAGNIRAAEERRDRALAEYEAALEELEWWRQGQRLFSGGDDEEPRSRNPVTELFPAASLFESGDMKPTLRQAIVAVMERGDGREWPLDSLVDALDQRGWLPDRADATLTAKGVADMAAAMASEGHLKRVRRGVYTVSPEIAAVFGRRLDG